MSIYNIIVKDKNENDITLESYKGKVLLIVNTATGCGFTPQYKGLQDLYAKYKDKGLEILDFPCNQFAGQAPGTILEIDNFCSLNYDTTFPRFSKINVNGKSTAPLFAFLKEQQKGVLGSAIKWNFTKFLVDRNGTVVHRFAPADKPEDFEKDILALL
ncbi:MAG TPA: glutathione peroxidase [Bacilli bacterium]|nr:glutathione peroxidase [Bacilli bacterium]